MKTEKLNCELNKKYPDLEIIISNNEYTEQDLIRYIRYCDKYGKLKINDMKSLEDIEHKAKQKGLESLIWRKDLKILPTIISYEGSHRENITESAYEVITDYGSFKINKSRQIFEDF